MTESVRALWVKSMHKCASVHAAVSKLTGTDVACGGDTQVDLGKSRVTRDFNDMDKLLTFFFQHNPFDLSDCRLRSISSGVVARENDDINCYIAEDVGRKIMVEIDNLCFTDVVLKKSNIVRKLSQLSKKVKVGDEKANIDPSILFARLLVIMTQMGNFEHCFAYELTAMPTALFKDDSLRKTDKSALAKEITKGVDTSTNIVSPVHYVLDGGCLIHRVVWPKSGTYLDVVAVYIQYVVIRYGGCSVIFDGYGNEPSIKDHEHVRKAKLFSPDLAIEESMPAYRNQAAFFANKQNKRFFIQLLSAHLRANQCFVCEAVDDADTVIAQCALTRALNKERVVVVADDTDVLALLVYHYNRETMDEIYMMSEIARTKSPRRSVIPISLVSKSIGQKCVRQLLAVHALSGCDTTSALHGRGKASVYRKIAQSPDTLPLTDILGSVNAAEEDVVQADMKLLVMVYGGKPNESLNHLRYITYMNMIANSKTTPCPERLPPTETAARFHLLRVHLQTVQWQTLMSVRLDAEKWGWVNKGDIYVPIATTLLPAPEEWLSIIRCQCKLTTNNASCSSRLCSCRKHGLNCVAACKNCFGEQCSNATQLSARDAMEDVDEGETEPVVETDASVVYGDFEVAWADEEIVEATNHC